VCGNGRTEKGGGGDGTSLRAVYRQRPFITEGTKINAQIIVEYDYRKNGLDSETSETLRMYDRDAMTWDDDRKAAALFEGLKLHGVNYVIGPVEGLYIFTATEEGTIEDVTFPISNVGTGALNLNPAPGGERYFILSEITLEKLMVFR
jgi:hypothetical protein